MFSSQYLTIVAKIRTVVVTREDGDRRRWRRWLSKDLNKPFISEPNTPSLSHISRKVLQITMK